MSRRDDVAASPSRQDQALWDLQVIEDAYDGDMTVMGEADRAIDRLRRYLEGDEVVYTR